MLTGMKNSLKMGIISALISLLFSCKEQVSPLSEDYYKKSGAIYFIPGGNGFERGSRKTVADVASFSVIKDVYARDKDHLYFMGCPQELVDVKTFQLKNKIPVDQQHVFTFEGFASATSACSKNQLTIIEGADPQTYTTLYHQLPALAKDKAHYFYRSQPLNVDYATFNVVNSNFVKDKNQLSVVTNKVFFRSTIKQFTLRLSMRHMYYWITIHCFTKSLIKASVYWKSNSLRQTT
jgi:hypothetical protein